MLSDFDRQNIKEIIRFDKPDFNWFTAYLLRAMFRAGFDAIQFEPGFPEEYNLIAELHCSVNDWNAPPFFETKDEFISALYFLFGKADANNQLRLFVCFPKIALKWTDWIVGGCSEKEFKTYWESVQ